MTTTFERVIAGPVVAPFDGDVARVVALPTGACRIEVWKRGAGWTTAAPGTFTPDEFVPGACRPVLENDAARLGCRLEDFGPHWTEMPATPRDRAKIVGLVKARAWDLACRTCAPGHA
jgi:hypothetical protein